MKEIKEILDRVLLFAPDERAILATVVDVRGSGYRLPGARMLMLENGDTFGMVSGGCLEADVLERAKKVLQTGRAEVFTYDTTNDENSVFSLNMGCRGVIRILLEAITKDDFLFAIFRLANEFRDLQVVATLIAVESDLKIRIGGRVYCGCEEPLRFLNLPIALETLPELRTECQRFYDSEESYGYSTFDIPEGKFEFAFEAFYPPTKILVFGAGTDAIPLVKLVSNLGWNVLVHDHRPAYLTSERFPLADGLVQQSADSSFETFFIDNHTAAIMMTHNYERDTEILPALLKSDVFYIGALGPKRRTEQLLGELAANGENFTEEQLAKLYAPAGLDIGADTPEAIALSIIAEIQSVMKDRNGGHLRDRKGSIYGRK